jgi:hypothetical protein
LPGSYVTFIYSPIKSGDLFIHFFYYSVEKRCKTSEVSKNIFGSEFASIIRPFGWQNRFQRLPKSSHVGSGQGANGYLRSPAE